MELHRSDKPIIRKASRANLEIAAAALKPHIGASRWLGKTNRYVANTVDRLRLDHPLNVARQKNLSQYIAASVVLHANDGWSYLGRSIACVLRGDAHRALHLAYYAELRAAMSLLAGAGIGIFSSRHFVVTGPNSTQRLTSKLGTHEFTWNALKYWSRLRTSGTLFSGIVRPAGQTLDDWFAPLGGGSVLAPQAQAWFQQWGMDLGLATKDRDARNSSSYRPDGIPGSWTISSSDSLSFVQELWSLLEPSGSSSFEALDRYILRSAFERHYHGLTGLRPKDQPTGFQSRVQSFLGAQGLLPSGEERWRKFLLREEAAQDPKIFGFSSKRPGSPLTDHLAVLSRAVLLLRLATGSAHDLMKQVDIDADDLSFWWAAIGDSRGLWSRDSQPDLLRDLWTDISDTLNDLAETIANQPTLPSSTNSLSGLSVAIATLCTFERVGLWSLCPQ